MLKARGEMNYATMLSIEENLRKLAMLYHASLSKATDAGSASSFQNDGEAFLSSEYSISVPYSYLLSP